MGSSDVEPFAAVAGSQTNQISVGPFYEGYVITFVDFTPPGNRSASFVHGGFTVSTEGDWDIGALVNPYKLVYVASLTCFKTGELE